MSLRDIVQVVFDYDATHRNKLEIVKAVRMTFLRNTVFVLAYTITTSELGPQNILKTEPRVEFDIEDDKPELVSIWLPQDLVVFSGTRGCSSAYMY